MQRCIDCGLPYELVARSRKMSFLELARVALFTIRKEKTTGCDAGGSLHPVSGVPDEMANRCSTSM